MDLFFRYRGGGRLNPKGIRVRGFRARACASPLLLILLIPALNACQWAPSPRNSSHSLEARRHCGLELYSDKIQSPGDFISLGEKKAAEARACQNEEEKQDLYRCAMSAFEAATALNPKDHQPFLALGRFYGDSENFALAEKAYRDALAVKADCPDAYLGLAEIAGKRGDGNAAISLLQAMLLKAKKPPKEVFLQLGYLYEKSGQAKRAKKAFEKYLRLLDPREKEEKARVRARIRGLLK